MFLLHYYISVLYRSTSAFENNKKNTEKEIERTKFQVESGKQDARKN